MNTSATWRTLIVDDEPLAREGIRSRLTTLGGFDIVGECSSGRAAISAIRSHSPDVVFLDVQMPVVDGFGVIAEVGADAMPAIVFVTAHDHYALRAFDAHAIDRIARPCGSRDRKRVIQKSVDSALEQIRVVQRAPRDEWPGTVPCLAESCYLY